MSEHPTTDKPEASSRRRLRSPYGGEPLKLLLRGKPDWATLAVVGFALIVVSLVGSCGGGGGDEPAESISEAATELADDLSDLNPDTEQGNLDSPTDSVRNAAQRLARYANPEYDDVHDLRDAVEAVRDLRQEVMTYIEEASMLNRRASLDSEDDARASLEALERAREFISSDSIRAASAELMSTYIDVDFERNARRYEERDGERYLEAVRARTEAQLELDSADATTWAIQADAVVVYFDGSEADKEKVNKEFEEALDIRNEAHGELQRHLDDVRFYEDLIEWRDR